MSSKDDVHEAFAKIRELNEGVKDGLRAMEAWLRRARGASTLSAEGLQAIGMALRVHQRLQKVEEHKSLVVEELAKRELPSSERPKLLAALKNAIRTLEQANRAIDDVVRKKL